MVCKERSLSWCPYCLLYTSSRTTVNVAGHKTIGEANCALCGQCITHCPVGALSERDDTEKVWEAIENKEKIVVAQVAPAVRTAWGEELGLSGADAPVGKIFDALKTVSYTHLEEETGFRSENLEFLMTVNTTVAFCDERIGVYIAKDLIPSKQHLDADESIDVEEWEVKDLLDLIYSGKMTDAKTIAAILAYAQKEGIR